MFTAALSGSEHGSLSPRGRESCSRFRFWAAPGIPCTRGSRAPRDLATAGGTMSSSSVPRHDARMRIFKRMRILASARAIYAAEGRNELTNRMRRSLGSPTPMLRLERAIRIVLEYGMRYPNLIELLLTTRQPASGPFAFLRARVDECVRAGAPWNDDR